MGKAEKIVVLSILFLVVVLFVWSLGGDANAGAKAQTDVAAGDAKVTATTPESDEGTFARRPGAEPESEASADTGREDSAPNAGEFIVVDPVAGDTSTLADDEPVQALAVRMRPGWDIVTTEGLETTIDPNTLAFRPDEGATWESIADAVYGDASLAVLLRHNNEGMETPGDVVLVPALAEPVAELTERLAVVRQGESLWGVARRTLGKGSRWREIYEANRDVIADPDYVAPGTELSIPAR